MRNRHGFGLLGILMIMAIVLPLLYMSSAGVINQTSSIRAQQRQRLQMRDAFQNLAVLLRQAYDKAKSNPSCPSKTRITTPSGNVDLCITANTCVKNEEQPSNAFCLQPGIPSGRNIEVMAVLDIPDEGKKWWASLPDLLDGVEFGPTKAHAQTKPSPSLPTLSAPPSFNRPGVAAPVRRCNGTDLVCLTLRLCARGTSCANNEAYYQRIGFTPPH
ncbi:MAG: type II secretion system protein [Bdellovibrionaceae bacterium]|nr:type II secretion system protein [Pseudobdellovibrionaceae bacterium]